MADKKLKVGDKARVIGNTTPHHYYDDGAVVEILEILDAGRFGCNKLSGGGTDSTQFLSSQDLEPISDRVKDSKRRPEVGDQILVRKHYNASGTERHPDKEGRGVVTGLSKKIFCYRLDGSDREHPLYYSSDEVGKDEWEFIDDAQQAVDYSRASGGRFTTLTLGHDTPFRFDFPALGDFTFEIDPSPNTNTLSK
jgi:hypothetical protein